MAPKRPAPDETCANRENFSHKGIDASSLIDYCRNQGGLIHSSLGIKPDGNGGFGIFATDEIARNEIIVKIPSAALLDFRNSDIMQLILDDDSLDRMIRLVITYIYEKSRGTSSRFYEMIKWIPDMEQVPRLWDIEERNLLRGTEVEVVGGLNPKLVKDTYQHQAHPFFERNFEKLQIRVSEEEYAKALSTISARAFEIDNYHELAVVPFSFLLNHSNNPHVHFENEGEVCPVCGAVCGCSHNDGPEDEQAAAVCSNENDATTDTCDLRMVRSARLGEEIFNTYGRLGNDVLLSRYGFALYENKYNRVSLKSQVNSLAKAGPKHAGRREWWLKNGTGICSMLGIVDDEESESDSDEEDSGETINVSNNAITASESDSEDADSEIGSEEASPGSNFELDDSPSQTDDEIDEFDEDRLIIFDPSSPHRALIPTVFIYICSDLFFSKLAEQDASALTYLERMIDFNEKQVRDLASSETGPVSINKANRQMAEDLSNVFTFLQQCIQKRIALYHDSGLKAADYAQMLENVDEDKHFRKTQVMKVIFGEKSILEKASNNFERLVKRLSLFLAEQS